MKNAFAHNAFAASGGISQTAADARYARLASANTFSAAQTFSVNGAASTPPLALTGTIFTGGSATTTKPALLIEPTGTTSNNWSTAGTLFGGNAPSGFTGMLLDLQINGDSQFKVEASSGGYARVKNSLQFGVGGVGSCGISVHATDNLLFSSDNNYVMKLYSTGLVMQSTAQYGISDGTSYAGTPDVAFARTSAGVGRISDGSTGRGTLDAAGYQVGGVAGASGTGTVISAITVTNGIITSITVA